MSVVEDLEILSDSERDDSDESCSDDSNSKGEFGMVVGFPSLQTHSFSPGYNLAAIKNSPDIRDSYEESVYYSLALTNGFRIALSTLKDNVLSAQGLELKAYLEKINRVHFTWKKVEPLGAPKGLLPFSTDLKTLDFGFTLLSNVVLPETVVGDNFKTIGKVTWHCECHDSKETIQVVLPTANETTNLCDALNEYFREVSVCQRCQKRRKIETNCAMLIKVGIWSETGQLTPPNIVSNVNLMVGEQTYVLQGAVL